MCTIKITTSSKLPDEDVIKRDGYDFKGWYDSAVGGKEYNSSSVITESNYPSVLYARWEAKDYHIKVKENGAQVSSTEVSARYGESITNVPRVEKNGSSPDVYKVTKIGDGDDISLSEAQNFYFELPYTYTDDIEVTPVWERFVLTFHTNAKNVYFEENKQVYQISEKK